MINSCITSEERNILKSLIGKKLVCFKSEDKDSWNKIFGNIALKTEDSEIEIRNELTETEYFGETEDVSKLKIFRLSEENPFQPMTVTPVVETEVSEIIEDIIIIQDAISVTNSQGATIYEITMDQALVIKTVPKTFVISRDWHLEEEITFVQTSDYSKSVYSVSSVISEWSDEEDNSTASCKRSEVSLKEAKKHETD